MEKKNDLLQQAKFLKTKEFIEQGEYTMTKEFFKEVCKDIISNILPVIPDNEVLRVYRNGDFYTIECAYLKYTHFNTGTELIECPEGLNDEED